ncbi:MAG: response regulator [Anaerolineae bacterium]|nr:response regulator [Anaerolineae bacterium]
MLMVQEKRVSILIVDDEEGMRETLVDILEDLYQVEEASNGQEALCKVGERCYTLILMDIKMPVMDGVEALERIKSSHPELPVIMMTAYADSSAVEKARQRGAEAVVFKPLDMPKVLSLIERVIRRTATVR